MGKFLTIPAFAALICAAPLLAQQSAPVGDRDPDAADIVKTPVTDLNIDKKEIPELLVRAQQNPYDLQGLGRCAQLISAVEELDALLGPDLDLPQETRDRIAASRVGKAVVNSFIPFRGIIREVSGASEHQRRERAAIQGGLARRGFLKGVGQSRGCKYPARAATRDDVDRWLAQTAPAEEPKPEKKRKKDKVEYISGPVVQPTN